MSEDLLRYDILTQQALRGMLADILREVAKTGLPGEHHFFVTFDTNAKGVTLSDRMRERYPEEMTIVVQHRFWDLEVHETYFQIGLSFDDIPETLIIPLAAIKGFYDPSVKFGLQFEVEGAAQTDQDHQIAEISDFSDQPSEGEKEAQPKLKAKKSAKPSKSSSLKSKKPTKNERDDQANSADDDVNENDSSADNDGQSGADVVSLDSFRKRK